MKKLFAAISLFVCIALIFTACGASAGSGDKTDVTETAGAGVINIGFLKGPTGLGAVQFMKRSDAGETSVKYNVQTAADPTSFTASLINGELDIAALPVNAAATLAAKTNGKVQLLAVNTLGVMYILDSTGEVNGIADLKGKTVLSSGQGSTPEYIINYLLKENGLKPGVDVTVEYAAEHAEVAAQALAGKYGVVLLPEPFVTKLQQKNNSFRTAIDLTEEWEKLGGGEMLTGCVAVRTEFAENDPQAVKSFLSDYEKSVDYALSSPDETAALAGEYDIIDAETAKAALPNCNITFMAGEEMKTNTAAYLQVLFDADPASVGGEMPGDGFYCIPGSSSDAK